jgi:hypothetical protein
MANIGAKVREAHDALEGLLAEVRALDTSEDPQLREAVGTTLVLLGTAIGSMYAAVVATHPVAQVGAALVALGSAMLAMESARRVRTLLRDGAARRRVERALDRLETALAELNMVCGR